MTRIERAVALLHKALRIFQGAVESLYERMADKLLTPEGQRRREVDQYNSARVNPIDDVLMILSRSLVIRWE